MCIRQGMFFVDVQALVMNGKPLDRKAFENGHTLATLKRSKSQASLRSSSKNNATPSGNLTRDLSEHQAREAMRGRS